MAVLAVASFAALLAVPAAAQTADPVPGIDTPLTVTEPEPGVFAQAPTGYGLGTATGCTLGRTSLSAQTFAAACTAIEGARVSWNFEVTADSASDHGIQSSLTRATSGLSWSYANLVVRNTPQGQRRTGTYRLAGSCNADGNATLTLRGGVVGTVAVTCTEPFTALAVGLPSTLTVATSGTAATAMVTVTGTNRAAAVCSASNTTTSGSPTAVTATVTGTGGTRTLNVTVVSGGDAAGTVTVTCAHDPPGSADDETASDSINWAYTAPPNPVVIRGLPAVAVQATGDYVDPFTVEPNTATCTATRVSGSDDLLFVLTGNSNAGTNANRGFGASRYIGVGSEEPHGVLVVDIVCSASGHSDTAHRIQVTFPERFVTSSGLALRGTVSGGETSYMDSFTVTPSTASCELLSLPSDHFTLTFQRSWTLSGTFVYNDTYGQSIRCTHPGYTPYNAFVLVTVTGLADRPRPQITITGLPATEETITGSIRTSFTVDPRQATCTDDSASATVSVDQSNASLRHLTITRTVGSGDHTVTVTCSRVDHDSATASITGTFNSPPDPDTPSVTWDAGNPTYTGDANGAAVVTHAYTVNPADISCTITRTAGTATLDATTDTTGTARSVTLTFTEAGSVTVRAACTGAPNADSTVTVTTADQPAQELGDVVMITGLSTAPTETTNRHTQTFNTNPASATCTHSRTGGLNATWSSSGKTLTVSSTTDGVAQGQIVCSASGFSDGIENVSVTFGPVVPAADGLVLGPGYEFLGGSKTFGDGTIYLRGNADGRAVSETDGGLESVFGVSFYSPSFAYGRVDFTQTAVTSCSASRRGGSSSISYSLSQRRYQRISDSEWVTSSSGAAYVGYARTARATADGAALFRVTCGSGTNRGQFDVRVEASGIARSGDTIQPFTGTDRVQLVGGTGTASVNVRTVPTSLTCTVARAGGTLTVSPSISGSAGSYTVSATSTRVGTLTFRVTCGTVSRSGTFTFEGVGTPDHTITIASRAQRLSGSTTISLPFSVSPESFDCTVRRSGGTLDIAPAITSYQNGGVHQFVTATSSEAGTLGITLTCADAVASATMTWTEADVPLTTIHNFTPATITLSGATATITKFFTVTPTSAECSAARTGGSLSGIEPSVGGYVNGGIHTFVSATSAAVGTLEVTLTCGAAMATARFTFAAPPAPTYSVTRFEDRTAVVTDGIGRTASTYTVTPFRADCSIRPTGGTLAPAGVLASGVQVLALAHIDGFVQPYVEVITRMVGTVNVEVTCGSATARATFTFEAPPFASAITGFAGRTARIIDGIGRASSTYTVTPYRGDCTAEATSGSLMDSATILQLAHINGGIQPYIEVSSRTAGSVTVTITCGTATTSAIFRFTSSTVTVTIRGLADQRGSVGQSLISSYTTMPSAAGFDCTAVRTSGLAVDPFLTSQRLATLGAVVIVPAVAATYDGTTAGTMTATLTCGTATATVEFRWDTAATRSVVISGFASQSGVVGRNLDTLFRTDPVSAGLDCSVARVSGVTVSIRQPYPVYLSADRTAVSFWAASAASAAQGSAVLRLTCGTATADATFTWADAGDPISGAAPVLIAGLRSTHSGTLDLDTAIPQTLTLDDEFTVSPPDASCRVTGTTLFVAASITVAGDPIGPPSSSDANARRLHLAFTAQVVSEVVVECTADGRGTGRQAVPWQALPPVRSLAAPPDPPCPADQTQTWTDRRLTLAGLPCVISMSARVEHLAYYTLDPDSASCTWTVTDTAETRRWSVPDDLRVAFSTSGAARYLRLYARTPGTWSITGICLVTLLADDGTNQQVTYTVSGFVRATASELPSFGGFATQEYDYGWTSIWSRLSSCSRSGTEAARQAFDAARDHYIETWRAAAEYLVGQRNRQAAVASIIPHQDFDLSHPWFQNTLAALNSSHREAVTNAYAEYRRAGTELSQSGTVLSGSQEGITSIPILSDILGALVAVPRWSLCITVQLVVPDSGNLVSILVTNMGNRGTGCTGDGPIEACDEGGLLLWPIEAVATAQATRQCEGPRIVISAAMGFARQVGKTSDLATNQAHLMVTPMDYLMESDFDALDGNWFSTCADAHDGVWAALWNNTAFSAAISGLVFVVLAFMLFRAVRALYRVVIHEDRRRGGGSGRPELGP